jgi:hypothetical protein
VSAIGAHSNVLRNAKRGKETKRAQATNLIIAYAEGSFISDEGARSMSTWDELLAEHLAKLSDNDRQFCRPLRGGTTLNHHLLKEMLQPLRIRYEGNRFEQFVQRMGVVLEHVNSFGRAIDVICGGNAGPVLACGIWAVIRLLIAVSLPLCRSYFKLSIHLKASTRVNNAERCLDHRQEECSAQKGRRSNRNDVEVLAAVRKMDEVVPQKGLR